MTGSGSQDLPDRHSLGGVLPDRDEHFAAGMAAVTAAQYLLMFNHGLGEIIVTTAGVNLLTGDNWSTTTTVSGGVAVLATPHP